MLMKRFIACALGGFMALVLTNLAEAKGPKSSSGGGGPTYGAATSSQGLGSNSWTGADGVPGWSRRSRGLRQ
jgi:hypothetical protein